MHVVNSVAADISNINYLCMYLECSNSLEVVLKSLFLKYYLVNIGGLRAKPGTEQQGGRVVKWGKSAYR